MKGYYGADYRDQEWPFQGCYLRFYPNYDRKGDYLSSNGSSESQGISKGSSESQGISRKTLIKSVSLGLAILLFAVIVVIFIIRDLRDYKTRYYTSTGTMKILQQFTPELNDKNSPEYKTLTSKFCYEMGKVFPQNSTQGKTYRLCDVTSLGQGSVIVFYSLYFDATVDLTNNIVFTTIRASLRVVNSQDVFGDFPIDKTALTLTTTLAVYEKDPLPQLESNNEISTPPTTSTIPSTMETTTTSTMETTTMSTMETSSTTSTVQTTTQPTTTISPTSTIPSTMATTTTSTIETTTTSPMETTTSTIETTTTSTKETTTTPPMETTTTSPIETTTSTMETTTSTIETTTTSPMETTTSPMETTTTSTMETTTSTIETTTTSPMESTTSPMETTTSTIETTTTSPMESTTSTVQTTTLPTTTLPTLVTTEHKTTSQVTTSVSTTEKPISTTTQTSTTSISSTTDPSTVTTALTSTTPITETTTTPVSTNTQQPSTEESTTMTTPLPNVTTTFAPLTAEVLFPSMTVLAKCNTSMECLIYTNDSWDQVTVHLDSMEKNLLLAVYSSNGTVTFPQQRDYITLSFDTESDRIRVRLNINLDTVTSCPSLLRFTCGINMADRFQSSFMNTSVLSITAPVHNVTLNMSTVYNVGQRLELTCQTKTDMEYGQVYLEVRQQNFSIMAEMAPRDKYATSQNEDCSVDFEWTYKSNLSLVPSLNGSTITCTASNKLLQETTSSSKMIFVLPIESTSTTTPLPNVTTTSTPIHADVVFPSLTAIARSNTTTECLIYTNDSWDQVTVHLDSMRDNLLLAVYSSNGSVIFPEQRNYITVSFHNESDRIRVRLNINLGTITSCPSLLRLTCGITMADILQTSFTNTSLLYITAPVHNVTLNMSTVYYVGQRLELTCRTRTDLEYGQVHLEVTHPNFSVPVEMAPRDKYATSQNEDCSVDFEWTYKSNMSLIPSLNGSTITCIASNRLLQDTTSSSKTIYILPTESTSTTIETPNATSTLPPFDAEVLFPSLTVLAKSNTTMECLIYTNDSWDRVTIHQDSSEDVLLLAVYSSNGSATFPEQRDYITVSFNTESERVRVQIHVNLAAASFCPSLFYFTCGITMTDMFRTSFTNTSVLSISAPVRNVSLDMATEYYTGQRLELTCRTITDFEYGQVHLEVTHPNFPVPEALAPRDKYASKRNEDCSVNFEWNYKSDFSLVQSLNGSTITCTASNKLLQDTISSSKTITVLTTDVSFEQYFVSGTPGDGVTVKCQTNTPESAIDDMFLFKSSNETNTTIAAYSKGNITSISGTSASFQEGILTVEFQSLQCSDEGQYFCVVRSGSTEETSPLPFTLQPTVKAGYTPVLQSLLVDIVENYFRFTSVHSCTGEIGYPDVEGFLSLTFSNPTKTKTVTYNEKSIKDSMTIRGQSALYNYSVTLADDFQILVKEDRKERTQCSTIHRVGFYLNVSRDWNMGTFRCEVLTNKGAINSSVKEEQFYVIPSHACDESNINTNKSIVFIDHEKQDNCNSYIQCGSDAPYGSKCDSPSKCAYIGKAYCDDCKLATCAEKASTTDMPTTTKEVIPVSEYMSCNSSSAYEGESTFVSCLLYTSSFTSLNLSRAESAIASVLADGTEIVSPGYRGKFTVLYTPTLSRVNITIHSMSCSDHATYTVMMYLDTGNVTSTTFTVNMKVKPENPKLTLNPNLVEGENSESHSCSGEVGLPAGKLEIQTKRSGDSEFTIYSPPNQKTSSSLGNSGNCTYVATLNFSIDLTSDSWTNVTVRCVVSGPDSEQSLGSLPISPEYVRSSISSDFCVNKTADYYDLHPQGCPFYVWCVHGRPYGQVCSAEHLCMNVETKICA